MSRALFTAVSGLRNHQVWLDVIGNNIANANTVGFKASTVVFDDILGQTISSGVAPTASKGGVNPVQVGLGMTIGSIGLAAGMVGRTEASMTRRFWHP